MKQALQMALNVIYPTRAGVDATMSLQHRDWAKQLDAAINTCRDALKQEPVAWLMVNEDPTHDPVLVKQIPDWHITWTPIPLYKGTL